jgi:hypothetical protein
MCIESPFPFCLSPIIGLLDVGNLLTYNAHLKGLDAGIWIERRFQAL